MAWLLSKVGDVVVSFFLETALERALEELKRICRVPEDIQSLTTTVKLIKAVLKDAEEKQVSDEAVRYWLRDLKQAFLDAEDLVDEITTDAVLKLMDAKGSDVSTIIASLVNKFQTAQQIKHINKTIEDLARQKDMLGLQPVSSIENRLVEYRRRQPTSSLLADKTSVIGRDREKEEIKRLLLSSCEAESSNSRSFSVLPIVGMGGLGKTTLARLVYNDEKVRKHFEVKMWVCVSNDFDLIRLTREIIEAASASKGKNEQCPIATNWDSLQQKLRQEVKGKTFLLVLDDVWVVSRRHWDDLFEPLNFAKKGSKIVMTTRSSNAVEINQRLLGPIILRGLSDDDFWSLFKRCAFCDCSPQDYSLLEGIGREIVKRLKGIPLAAKAIGNLLSTRLEVQHWRKIGKSELLELEQGDDGILPALGLSYQYLPGNLRQCFAYCSLFPEDHVFSKTQLTRLWDAQCYSGMEDISNEYFDNLHSRSIFESDYGRYVMHDLIHDLAEYVSKDDCFRLDDKKSMEIPETVRHVSVYATRFDQAKLNQLRSREKLRTLLFSHSCDFHVMTRAVDELFSELKRLRVLGLSNCGINELPRSVGAMKHLRYIDLSHNPFENLPESLCDLYNLQVLNLRFCGSLVALPTRMSKLINLRHLVVDVDLVSGIDGLGKLTLLQEVTVKGSKVRELRDMDMLRVLEIIHMEEVGTDAVEAGLDSKEHLRVLKLMWDATSINHDLHVGTLQALKPVDTLKDLCIGGYGGVKPPGWMEDPAVWTCFCLESLQLIDCLNWEVLPSLGQLRRLKSLKIESCPELRELPPLPPMLEWLKLKVVGLTSVEGTWGCRGGGGDGEETSPSHSTSPALAHVSIDSCPKLTSLSGMLQHPLTALRVLRIKNCGELQKLTERGLGHLVSLKELYITDCPKLNITCSSLVPLPLPSSLQKFKLERCPTTAASFFRTLPLGRTTAASFFRTLPLGRHHRLATSLTELEIHDCGSDNSVPSSSSPQPSSRGVFRSLTSLKTLVMSRSRHLLQEWAGTGLPSSLETLDIRGDDDLDDGCLATCLGDLTSLTHLSISHCSAITSLPDYRRDLTSLTHLSISHCPAITSLPDCLRDHTSLIDLSIVGCPALTSLPGVGVPAAGRRSQIPQLSVVTINSCNELTSVQDFLDRTPLLHHLTLSFCEKLSSLPATLNCLSFLETLRIDCCPKIESLPDLPASLQTLYIRGCPMLKERCKQTTGPDWLKISEIPCVDIDE